MCIYVELKKTTTEGTGKENENKINSSNLDIYHFVFPLELIFLRVYSYFMIYQAILQKCRSLPYDERLQNNAARELNAVNILLRDMYHFVNKKYLCNSKFSATEFCLFEKLIDSEVKS